MNSKEIFSLALNIEKPWYIKDIILEKPDSKIFGRLTIQIDFERGAKFTIEGGEVCSVYDTNIEYKFPGRGEAVDLHYCLRHIVCY